MTSAVLLAACGRKGPLIYPDLLVPEAPQQVQVQQLGDRLQLSFALPAKDRAGRALREPVIIQVQRRELNPDEPGLCGSSPADYLSLLKVDPAFPAPAIMQGGQVTLLDAGVHSGKRYQYRLVAVDRDGAIGEPAESLQVLVVPAVAAPVVTATPVFGGMIRLTITGPIPSGSVFLGYLLYRTTGAGPLPPMPLVIGHGVTPYLDQTVQRGIEYRYGARLFMRRKDGVVMLSRCSRPVAVRAQDSPTP